MRILSAASAFPAHHYTQKELVEAFLRHWGDRLPDGRKLEILHSNVGVEGRFLSMPIDDYPGLTFGRANDVWLETAQNLGQSAVTQALRRAGLRNADPSAFFFIPDNGTRASSSTSMPKVPQLTLEKNR